MVTDAKDYQEILWQIQKNALTTKALLLPTNEEIYEIDLNKRIVSVPKYLSVSKDHQAEVIYFKFDRYYDRIDLTTKACIIEYTNAEGKSYIYPVPYYDIETLIGQNKVIIPWCIQGPVTAKAGIVKFAFKWYSINSERKFTYVLRTLPAEGLILEGQNTEDETLSNEQVDLGSELLELIQRLEEVYNSNMLALYWNDV